MDNESFKKIMAKRGLAKLCLNSMCGKLTERNSRTQTKLISDLKELYRFLATPGIKVMNLMFANDDVVWVSWRFTAEERVPTLLHTNQVIGPYVSAGASFHLSKYLERIQERVFYCDTDSILYIQPRDEPELVETGTSELNPGEYVAEFVSGAKGLWLQGNQYIGRCEANEYRL